MEYQGVVSIDAWHLWLLDGLVVNKMIFLPYYVCIVVHIILIARREGLVIDYFVLSSFTQVWCMTVETHGNGNMNDILGFKVNFWTPSGKVYSYRHQLSGYLSVDPIKLVWLIFCGFWILNMQQSIERSSDPESEESFEVLHTEEESRLTM